MHALLNEFIMTQNFLPLFSVTCFVAPFPSSLMKNQLLCLQEKIHIKDVHVFKLGMKIPNNEPFVREHEY